MEKTVKEENMKKSIQKNLARQTKPKYGKTYRDEKGITS